MYCLSFCFLMGSQTHAYCCVTASPKKGSFFILPDGIMMSLHYVRVLYNFASGEQGEISLQEGDIVEVVKQVNSNWLCGKLRGHQGNFPANFVQDVNLPNVGPGQKLFAAIKNFRAQEDGDLAFSKGKSVGIRAGKKFLLGLSIFCSKSR